MLLSTTKHRREIGRREARVLMKSNAINLSMDLHSQQSISQHHNKVVFRQPKLLLTARLLQMQPALLPSASHALESLLFHPSTNKADGATEK